MYGIITLRKGDFESVHYRKAANLEISHYDADEDLWAIPGIRQEAEHRPIHSATAANPHSPPPPHTPPPDTPDKPPTKTRLPLPPAGRDHDVGGIAKHPNPTQPS